MSGGEALEALLSIKDWKRPTSGFLGPLFLHEPPYMLLLLLLLLGGRRLLAGGQTLSISLSLAEHDSR